jgi:hypothetical protein
MDLMERLAEIDLLEEVRIPVHLLRYVENEDTLNGLGSLSIVMEAQRAMRLFIPAGTAGHELSEELAEPIMGPANYYTLCRAKTQVEMLSAEDRLKLLAIFGRIHDEQGRDTAEVDVAIALGPAVPYSPAPAAKYVTRYLNERSADQFYFDQLKMYTDNMDHKYIILDIKERYLAWKYVGATPGCGTVTEQTHPIWRDTPTAARLTAEEYWGIFKPTNYKQRKGSPTIVWH